MPGFLRSWGEGAGDVVVINATAERLLKKVEASDFCYFWVEIQTREKPIPLLMVLFILLL